MHRIETDPNGPGPNGPNDPNGPSPNGSNDK